MSRFDYVAYDEEARNKQSVIKDAFSVVEAFICDHLPEARAKQLALAKLEESYMWVGKAVRDDQIERNGSAPLQEGRNNG